MGQTVIRFGDPKAVKIWSGRLFTETDKQSYFNKFEGTSENSIIQRKTDLESASGDRISFDLSVKLRKMIYIQPFVKAPLYLKLLMNLIL